jgi:hypothetical protein
VKRVYTYTLDETVAKSMESLARRLGVPYNALVERCIAVTALPGAEDAFEKWASTKRKGPKFARKDSERRALAALTNTWTSFWDIGQRSCQTDGILWRALKSLETAKLVESEIPQGAYWINGRPTQSRWRLVPRRVAVH